MKKIILLFTCALLLFASCKNKKNNQNDQDSTQNNNLNIAVFIPGSLAGSDTYQMLVDGVQKAVDEFIQTKNFNKNDGVNVSVIEAGFNQAEWETKLTALAAAGLYSVIISSNPSMPVIADSVSKKFPSPRFMIFDGAISGNKNIYTLRYKNEDQAFVAGHLAALLVSEAGGKHRIGLITAQEYPVMMQSILPGYREGARSVLSDIDVDFRVIGNWYDAAKAADITALMIADGANVILTIAGGANDGALKAAESAGAKIIWFDTNGYALRPGVVAGSCAIHQDKAAYDKTKLFLEDALPFGTTETAGFAEGYVDFIQDDPLYIKNVSDYVRQKQSALLQKMQ
jgi:simple sugar transport system substrate-binding protein